MDQSVNKPGIKRLIDKYVSEFRIPENLEHYSPEDFEKAERRFVKFCLNQGPPPELKETGQ